MRIVCYAGRLCQAMAGLVLAIRIAFLLPPSASIIGGQLSHVNWCGVRRPAHNKSELVRGQETRAQQVELVRGRETRAQQISASRIGGQHSHVQRGAIGISRDLVNAKNAKEPGEIGRIKEVVAAEMFGKCGQK